MTTTYHVADIRNVALAGHGASGKTTLADALLFTSGAIDSQGLRRRRHEHARRRRRRKTPAFHDRLPPRPPRLGRKAGSSDRHAGLSRFHRQRLSALAAVENVVVAVSGPSGVEVNTRRVFQEAGRLGLGRFVVVTKMDAENVDYRSDLAAIRETFGTLCVPFNVPIGQGASFSGCRRRHPVPR